MPFALARRSLVGRGHFDRRLSWFTGGRKAWIDEILVVSAQSHQCINYPIEDGSCSFFFSGFDWVTWKARFNSSLPPTTILISSFHLFWHLPSFPTFNPYHMAISRTRMPSFTLVLTSGWHSLHGYPTAIKFDPCASYTMLPAVIDHLLVN